MKSRWFPTLIAAGLVVILSACTEVSMMRLKDYESRLRTARVDVYANAAAVTRAYKEIAMISCDTHGNSHGEDFLDEKIVDKAKEIGADGIILETPQTSGGHRTVTRAIAIVYK